MQHLLPFFISFIVGTIDNVASETLAKVEEKFPIITKTPSEVGILHVCSVVFDEGACGR